MSTMLLKLLELVKEENETVNFQPYYQAAFQSDSDVFSKDRLLQLTVS